MGTTQFNTINKMKLSTSLFAVAMAQFDYESYDFIMTTTEEVQTTPLSFDPSSLNAENFDLSDPDIFGAESADVLDFLDSLGLGQRESSPRESGDQLKDLTRDDYLQD